MSRPPPKPFELEDRDGRQVRVYESGAVLDHETGKIVTGPPEARITKANASALAQRRHTLAAQKLRARILKATQDKSDAVLTGPADAVAEAGGILWEEIVLADPSSGVYPRDRIQAWEMLGKHAGVLLDPRLPPDAAPVQRVEHALDAETLALLRAVRDKQVETIEGKVSEVGGGG